MLSPDSVMLVYCCFSTSPTICDVACVPELTFNPLTHGYLGYAYTRRLEDNIAAFGTVYCMACWRLESCATARLFSPHICHKGGYSPEILTCMHMGRLDRVTWCYSLLSLVND